MLHVLLRPVMVAMHEVLMLMLVQREVVIEVHEVSASQVVVVVGVAVVRFVWSCGRLWWMKSRVVVDVVIAHDQSGGDSVDICSVCLSVCM